MSYVFCVRLLDVWVEARVNNSREGEYPMLNRPVLNEHVEQPGYHRTFLYFLKVSM